MRIMAIDYGDAHTGIAISDATGFLAMDPLTGAKQYTDEELITHMQTPFGGTFISVGKAG